MAQLVTVTTKYQVSIPVSLADKFQIKPKDKVLIESADGVIKITPLKARSFLDLFGVIKSDKKLDFKKMRRAFEKETAKNSVNI